MDNSAIPQFHNSTMYVCDRTTPSEKEQFVKKCKENLMGQMHAQLLSGVRKSTAPA